MGSSAEQVDSIATEQTPQAPRPIHRRPSLWIGVFLMVALTVLAVARIQEATAPPPEPATKAPAAVEVMPISKGIVRRVLRAEGTLRAVRREFLTFEQTGRVIGVARDDQGGELRPGMRVRGPTDEEPMGQLLARIDDRDQSENVAFSQVTVAQSRQDVQAQSAALQQARGDLALAEAQLRRTEALYQTGDASMAQLEQSRAAVNAAQAGIRAKQASLEASRAGVQGAQAKLGQAKVQASRTALHAPFDGVIAAVNIRQGDYSGPGYVDRSSEDRQLATAPVVLIDPTEFEANLDIPAFEAARVKPGQTAVIMDARSMLSAPPSEAELSALSVSIGHVFSVAQAIDATSRTVRVSVRTRQGVDALIHGQFVSVILITDERQDAVVVTEDVRLHRDGQVYAFVVEGSPPVARRRALELGLQSVRSAEVLGGLQLGELAVTAGRHRLTDGAPVTIARQVEPRLYFQQARPAPGIPAPADGPGER